MRIRAARPADAPAILSINARCQPHVASLDAHELTRLTHLASIAHVVESTQVVAYLIAMHSDDVYDGEEFAHFRSTLRGSFLYVDQVAVDPGARRVGAARMLYAEAQRWCREHRVGSLCCEVNLEPLNAESLTFHDRLGFNRSGELRTRDGRYVALLTRAPDGA